MINNRFILFPTLFLSLCRCELLTSITIPLMEELLLTLLTGQIHWQFSQYFSEKNLFLPHFGRIISLVIELGSGVLFCFFFQHVKLFHSTLLPCMIWWEVHCNSYLCSSIGKAFVICSVCLFLTTFKVFSLLFYLYLSIPLGVLWTSLVHRSGLQLILESSQRVLGQIFLVHLLIFASGTPVMHMIHF